MTQQATMPRRHFLKLAGGAATALLGTPAVIHAQSLSRNDIWTKQPTTVLKSAVTLCLDTSSSMKEDEPYIQRDGTAAAISHASIRHIIKTPDHYTGHRGVAVCAIAFNNKADVIGPPVSYSYLASSSPQERFQGRWAVLETDDDVDQFANFIMERVPVHTVGGTNIIDALEHSHIMHKVMPHKCAKMVCDISGDGGQSPTHGVPDGAYANAQTQYAHLLRGKSLSLAEAGILVNCFAMTAKQDKPGPIGMNQQLIDMDLRTYYETFLQSPPEIKALEYQGGFTIDVSKGKNLREAYPIGMIRKMSREFF